MRVCRECFYNNLCALLKILIILEILRRWYEKRTLNEVYNNIYEADKCDNNINKVDNNEIDDNKVDNDEVDDNEIDDNEVDSDEIDNINQNTNINENLEKQDVKYDKGTVNCSDNKSYQYKIDKKYVANKQKENNEHNQHEKKGDKQYIVDKKHQNDKKTQAAKSTSISNSKKYIYVNNDNVKCGDKRKNKSTSNVEKKINSVKANNIEKSNLNKKTKQKTNKIIGSFPIILAKRNVYVPIETCIELGEKALEVKDIKNNVYLMEAILVPTDFNCKTSKFDKGRLILKGFIRNSIHYSVVDSIDDEKIKGNIKYCIKYIPFKCVTSIEYTFKPRLSYKGNVEKLVIKGCNDKGAYTTKDEIKCNEPIHCSLTKAKICGNKECCDKKGLDCKFPLETTFSTLKEKMILELVVELTQKQDVKISY